MAILEVMGLVETSDEEPTLTVDGVEGDRTCRTSQLATAPGPHDVRTAASSRTLYVSVGPRTLGPQPTISLPIVRDGGGDDDGHLRLEMPPQRHRPPTRRGRRGTRAGGRRGRRNGQRRLPPRRHNLPTLPQIVVIVLPPPSLPLPPAGPMRRSSRRARRHRRRRTRLHGPRSMNRQTWNS